jgi:hypothetical protein
LSPTDQDALVKQIGLALMRTAPDDWQQINAEFRATGRYYELSADVTDSDGNHHAWTASHDIAMHFAKLRAGMYREGRGTWFNARYQIEKPSSYNLEFDRQEPTWRTPPPPAAFRDELHFFPRTDDNVPEWLMRKLSGLPPERPGRRFRLARIFDGATPNGRPSVNRPQVSDEERDRLLEYLDHATMALPERGHDVDRLSPDGRPTVPVAFHTDGVWVWPAAVNYYLRRYGVPPDPELVNHARTNGFRPPEVDEPTRIAAAATITGGRPPGPPRPGGPGGPPGAPGGPGGPVGPPPAGPPPSPNGLAGAGRQVPPPAGVPAPPPIPVPAGPGITDLSSSPTSALNPPPPAVPPIPVAPQPEENAHALPDEPARQEEHAEEPARPVTPAPRGGSQQERTLNLLHQRLADLRVPDSTYRIGEPAPQTWYLEQVDEGWQVGWFDGEFSSPMLFDEVADASAFLLGKLLLGVPAESALHDNVGVAPAVHDEPAHDEADDEDTQQNEVPLDREVAERIAPADPGPSVGLGTPLGGPPPMGGPPPLGGPPPMGGPPPVGGPGHGRGDGVAVAEPVVEPIAATEDHPDEHVELREPVTEPPHANGVEVVPEPVMPHANNRAPESAPPPPADWPIQPLAGEPPLTLFRGKRLLELQPGTEVDRFGTPEGNLTYVAGTPFEQRSLVPDWVHRPYHVYRITRPVQALSGGAIPWFDQPGGGTAYLLPRAVEEMLGAGDLVEVEPAEPPVG